MDKIQTTDCWIETTRKESDDFLVMSETPVFKKEGVIVLTPTELEKIKSDAEWAAYNSGYIEGRKSTFE